MNTRRQGSGGHSKSLFTILGNEHLAGREVDSPPFALQCPDSLDPQDTCVLNPLREPFAKKECSILLSEVFETCHPVVSGP